MGGLNSRYELAMWPESSDEDLARVVKVVGEGISRWHHVEGNWYKVFLLIDTQGTGTITFEDLKKFLRGTYPGLHLNREELPSEDMFGLWKAMDSTVQMKVPKSEFMTFMRRYSGQAPEKPPQVRDLAQEIAGAPELGRDQLRAVAIKIQGIVQSWLARKGYTCNSSTSPEAWAQIFKHLVDGVRLSFLGLEAAIFGAMKGRGQVSEAELMALWRILDVDRSGEVREAEFATSLYRLQTETWPRLSNNNIERLIEILNAAAQKWHRASGNWYKILTICDEEDSGRLNFDEFCKVVRKGFPGLSIGVAEISEDELRQRPR
ncbi:unnamed protein product [Effrenium voratum]|uniref:EF-hand domain-containing protein n=1 Tax=Effrenium voratum TaxID=2562239 RepID=A0AA36JR80_9DINO|nr:unnamed protein product [Effrenium voratum]